MGRGCRTVHRPSDRLRPARPWRAQTTHQRLGIADPHRARRRPPSHRGARQQGHRHTALRLTTDRANPPHPRLHQTRAGLTRTTRPRSSPPHLTGMAGGVSAGGPLTHTRPRMRLTTKRRNIGGKHGYTCLKSTAQGAALVQPNLRATRTCRARTITSLLRVMLDHSRFQSSETGCVVAR